MARTETTGWIGADEATIRQVQTGLSELGYLPGGIDGTFGETTRQAIKAGGRPAAAGKRRDHAPGPERARQDFGADEFLEP